MDTDTNAQLHGVLLEMGMVATGRVVPTASRVTMPEMEPTPQLAARLDADRSEAAAHMTFSERLLAGAAMFDTSVVMMRAGIRLRHPDADEKTVRDLVLEQLRNARRFESRQ